VNAEHVARALGGRPSPTGFVCPCPLPGHGRCRGDRRPSLSVTDGEGDRLLVHCFGGCDPLDVLAELRRRGLVEDPKRQPWPPRPSRRRAPVIVAEPHPEAVALWRSAVSRGEHVERYLRGRRIGLPIPPTIRQGAGLLYGRIPMPTMLAAVQGPDRRVVAVQETRLTWQGRKAPIDKPRWTTGKLYDGAVRLAAAGEVLGLAEGVETALSAMQLAGVPVWASLGSERLSLVRIPDSVSELHVFGDNDDPGRKAADQTAKRWTKRGITVRLRFPPDGFGDWNDYLQAPAVAA